MKSQMERGEENGGKGLQLIATKNQRINNRTKWEKGKKKNRRIERMEEKKVVNYTL